EALVHVQRRHPRGMAGATHGEGLGIGQRGLEPGGIGVGQVVAHRALRLQRGAGAGHRDVEGFVHGRAVMVIRESWFAAAAWPGSWWLEGAAVTPPGHPLPVTDQRMLITVWVAWSWVEIICALAWKLRWAVIMFTSCSVRSTVEASSAPGWMRPKSEESGVPLRGVPEACVAIHMLLPCACRPCGLTKLVSTIWPRATSSPLV